MMRTGKKWLSIFVATAMMVSGLSYSPTAEKTVMATGTESEIPEGYTPVRTVDELYGVRNNLKGKYILMNDIDLSKVTAEGGELDTGHGWTPIQNFAGTFDGNGYRIKGMQIRGKVPSNYVGLFGSLSYGSVIKNVGLVDVEINIDAENFNDTIYCGSLFGYGDSNRIILEKCFVKGQITIKSSNRNIYAGGICGYIDSTDMKITNCYNGVSIEVENDGNNKVRAGGIVGHKSSGEITNCYNYGMINNGQGGAIAEFGISTYESSHCFYLKGTGTNSRGGTPLTDSQMKNANYFTGYDFKNTWEVDPDSLYTYPQLKDCMQIRIKNLVLEEKPTKKEYNQGDELDISGGKLQITYEDDRTNSAKVIDLMIEPYDMMQIGEQDINIRKGNKTVSYKINVNPIPVTELTLNKTFLSMERGDEETLTATILPANATDQDIEWSSDNDDVATVDQKGKIRAIATGKAKIIAIATNGVKAECEVSVYVPCQSFEISNDLIIDDGYDRVLVINKGDTTSLSYTMYPASSTESVTWKIDNQDIVCINDQSSLTGLRAGKTTLTGATDSGKRDSVTVLVTEDISGFTVTGIVNKNYTGYRIEQDITVKNGNEVLREETHYSVSYAKNIDVGTATVTITGLSPYKGTITRTFKILEVKPTGTGSSGGGSQATTNKKKATKIKLGKSSIKKIKAGKGRLTLKWKKISKAAGYQIRIATNKKFTKGKKTYYSSRTSGYVRLKRKKTYYVRIRAYAYNENSNIVYGKYSSIKKKKTK